ncbi:MAG TPA: hypothetical protein VD997_09345 [Phycisphaerales bacterium]|nr:hypothetical protein [Phycisphaerales bacterium]
MSTSDVRGVARWVRTLLATAGLAASVTGWGCAGKPRAEARTAEATASTGADGRPATTAAPRYESLSRLAERQSRSPDRKALELPAPPGVDAGVLSPLGDEAHPRARRALAEVLAEFAPASEDAAGSSAQESKKGAQSDAGGNPQALRLYVSGRTKLLEGQAAKAVTDLESAARLDPNAPEVWRELGQAQLELGRRTSAMTSFQKAHRLGSRETRVTVLVAREDLRAKRYEDAAKKLAPARGHAAANNDPGSMQLLDVDLAEALGALGYLTASRDLLEAGLRTPVASIAASPLRNELAEVLRRRGDLWQRVGDVSFRLGEFGRAASAYAAAAEATALDPQALVAKQVYAHLKQGRSADAALVVVNDIRASEGRVEDRHMAVITYLARNTEVGPRLAEAVDEVAASMGPQATPTVLNRLARARAAALTGDASRGALRLRLTQSPFDADLAAEVLGAYAAEDVRGRVKEALALTSAAPIAAEVYAGVLLNRGQGVDTSVEMLAKDRSPAARLLYAAIVSKLGRPDLGLARLEGEFKEPYVAGGLALRASCAAACGKWDVAKDAEQRLAGLKTARGMEAHALTLKVLQQFAGALEKIDALLAQSGVAPATEHLLLAAELAIRTEQPARAEGYLRRALERDRFDERVYEPLISLYMTEGPLADEAKLTAVARQLRQNIPSSRVIRGINAQELIARSQWAPAETQLLGLLSEHNENGSVMNLLVTVWERAAKADPPVTERGERWLRERLEARPDSTLLVASLARVLAAQGKGEEAESLLASRLAKWPSPEVARMREWIAREPLGKPEVAERLALERLRGAPRGIDGSIELAELLVHRGEVAEATSTLVNGVPTDLQLTKDQMSRLAAVVLRMEPQKLAELDPENVKSALHLLELIAGRVPMGDHLHRLRLVLLTASHYDDPRRLIEAVEALAKEAPARPLDGYVLVLSELEKRTDGGPHIRFAAAAARHIRPALAAMYFEWLRVVAVRGTPADVEQFASELTDADEVQLLIEEVERRLGAHIKVPHELNDQKAELLYALGSLVPSRGREQVTERAYRLCLQLKPDHPWAANDLGYQLLERGENLEDADRLIRAAYAELSLEASVIDSMGWLLYKKGHIVDEVDADGNLTQQGAVTLLALAAADDPVNPTLADHYADALWRTGKDENREHAKVLWQQAEQILSERLAEFIAKDPMTELRKSLVEEEREKVRAKLSAAKEGREVPVAPLAPGVQVQAR